MMKHFVVILSAFALLRAVICRPSGFTRDTRVELPGNEKISKRSVDDYSKVSEAFDDDMEVAENGMVFLPLFRSRNRFTENQRFRRSAEEVSKTKTRTDVIESDDHMEVAENGMVFLLLFRSRNRFTESQRFRRSAEDTKTKTSSDVVETDDLERADDVISRSGSMRRFRLVRSVPEEESLRGADDNGLQGDDDMDVAENGLIFRPLFRTRQRDTRSVEIGLN